MGKFNDRLADRITTIVGTMWCAYAFALIALIGLPAVLGLTIVPSRFAQITLWVSSEFLQLVLLSVLAQGQIIQARSIEKRDEETHFASMSELEIAKEERALIMELIQDLVPGAICRHSDG